MVIKNWQSRIDKIGVSRARVAREAGLCEKTVCNRFRDLPVKNKKHARLSKTLARIESAICALEKRYCKLKLA